MVCYGTAVNAKYKQLQNEQTDLQSVLRAYLTATRTLDSSPPASPLTSPLSSGSLEQTHTAVCIEILQLVSCRGGRATQLLTSENSVFSMVENICKKKPVKQFSELKQHFTASKQNQYITTVSNTLSSGLDEVQLRSDRHTKCLIFVFV